MEEIELYKDLVKSLKENKSFVLLAGPGAGKTKNLIDVVSHLQANKELFFNERQKVAVITYTNAAKDEIIERLGESQDHVHCSTIHSFCWEVIKNFKTDILLYLQHHKKISESEDALLKREVDYKGTEYFAKDNVINLGHDDVLQIASFFLEKPKFKHILKEKYHYILIDEFQDTNPELLKALLSHLDGENLVFGLFGDDWQRIYKESFPPLPQDVIEKLRIIEAKNNYRSTPRIVSLLGRLRPEYKQTSVSEEHSNRKPSLLIYTGIAGNENTLKNALLMAEKHLEEQGWTFSGKDAASMLFLSRKNLAIQQGYIQLENIYPSYGLKLRFRDLQDPLIGFFISSLEPALQAYEQKQYWKSIKSLGLKNLIPQNKKKAKDVLELLLSKRNNMNSQKVFSCLKEIKDFSDVFPSAREKIHSEYKSEELRDVYIDLAKLPYEVIMAYARGREEESRIGTQHSSKGRQFSKVLVVCTQNLWRDYNFKEYFSNPTKYSAIRTPTENELSTILARNLFYVSCSRAKEELAVLIDRSYTDESINNLKSIFEQNCTYV
ncbi:UvrD-helicase domain-containing protein [uncultured Turicimonas sp.]|uniref:UvrD-helicase domain-containing protein n=1 Tax=uncultured Turicimonas sp. TaxID=1918607 RepID=UPI003211B442